MAGDWIPITTDLATRREVLLVSEATGLSRHEVVGRLVDFWGWSSHETTDGVLRHISVATLGATLSLQESFIRALINVDWLRETPCGLVVSNWDRWLSNSAKARLGNALRQKLYRSNRNGNVATCVATKALPKKRREEKRREDTRTPCSPPGDSAFDSFWKVVHVKTGRQAARKAFAYALRRLKVEKPGIEPAAYLTERMTAFAATPAAHPTDHTPIHPATWLNHGRYDDDPETWNRRGGVAASPSQEPIDLSFDPEQFK